MDTVHPARRMSRSLHRSIMAAHRNAAHDARALLVEGLPLDRVAKLREVLKPIKPIFLRSWREVVGRLRGSAESAGNQALIQRLNRLALHEVAVRDDDDGLALRMHVLDTVWPSVRDDAEEELCQLTEHLRSEINVMRADLEDVVAGHDRLNQNAEDLREEGACELLDLRELVVLNCTIGAHIDQSRSVLKVGEWLLEAITRSLLDAQSLACNDRRAWCCFFAQRALAVLATSTGAWVFELIDAQRKAVAAPVTSVPISTSEQHVPHMIASSTGRPSTAPPGLDRQKSANPSAGMDPTATTDMKSAGATDVEARSEHVGGTRAAVANVPASKNVGSAASAHRKHRQKRPIPTALMAELYEMGKLPDGELRRKPLASAVGERLGVDGRTVERCIKEAREDAKEGEPGVSAAVAMQWDDLKARARPRRTPPVGTRPHDDEHDEDSLRI